MATTVATMAEEHAYTITIDVQQEALAMQGLLTTTTIIIVDLEELEAILTSIAITKIVHAATVAVLLPITIITADVLVVQEEVQNEMQWIIVNHVQVAHALPCLYPLHKEQLAVDASEVHEVTITLPMEHSILLVHHQAEKCLQLALTHLPHQVVALAVVLCKAVAVADLVAEAHLLAPIIVVEDVSVDVAKTYSATTIAT